jgi:uncharacterized membrane protein (UPF0136 family)
LQLPDAINVTAQVCAPLFASRWIFACIRGEAANAIVQRNAAETNAATTAWPRFVQRTVAAGFMRKDVPRVEWFTQAVSAKRLIGAIDLNRPGGSGEPPLPRARLVSTGGTGANWTASHCWITGATIPRMLGPAKIYFILFGALTIAGGVIGYVKAGSVPSIVAGVITGVLLIAAGFLLPDHRAAALTIALITSLLLAGQFIPKFLRTGKAMPAGIMSILSAIGIIVALIAWIKK